MSDFQYQARDQGGNINLDPSYINSWLDSVDQERQRLGRPPMSPQERQEAYGYATKQDTYTGGGIYQGPNAYLFDRLTNPTSQSGSTVRPDQGNFIGMEQGPGGAGGAGGAGGVGGGALGQNFLGSYLGQAYGQPFQPTSINSILGSEAFQAANQEGLNSISRMKSASGDLHSGGTLKDLSKFTNSLALGAINDQYNRDLGSAGFNRDTFWGDRDRAFSRLSDFTRLGQAGAGQVGGYGSQYGQNSSDLITGQADAAANAALGKGTSPLGTSLKDLGTVDWGSLLRNQDPATAQKRKLL